MNRDDILTLDQGPAIEQARNSVGVAIGTDRLLALPDNFKLHDLEVYGPHRRRMRGQMRTSHPQHFADYIKACTAGTPEGAPTGAAVFIDTEDMIAQAILDLGTPARPGHADHRAELTLHKTAAFRALEALFDASVAGRVTQRILAEFMEDWAPFIECVSEQGDMLPVPKAIDAVRRITIKSARSVESSAQSLSAERSVMESVAATSKAAPLPATIMFRCVPHEHLTEHTFAMRLSVRTGDEAKPALTLGVHLIRAEEHREQMGKELAEQVTWRLADSGVPIYMGDFKVQ